MLGKFFYMNKSVRRPKQKETTQFVSNTDDLNSHMGLFTYLKNSIQHDIDERLEFVSEKFEGNNLDPFGMDLAELRKTAYFASFLYKYYFRCETQGIQNIPEGPVILVANHGGQVPIDAVMITTAVMLESTPPRLCRSMMDRFVPTLPFISTWFARVGVALGTPENAQRLLSNGAAMLTFPEGMTGIQKTLDRAYSLQPFGLGFIRLALLCKTPVVPIAVVGSEEQYPTLYQIRKGMHLFGLPSIPVWAQMFVPILGILPLPVKYRLSFGEPMHFSGDPDDDDDVIQQMADQVKYKIDQNLKQMREKRRGIFF